MHVNEGGSARVRSEVVTDLAGGVTVPQPDQLLGCCDISTGQQMRQTVAEPRR